MLASPGRKTQLSSYGKNEVTRRKCAGRESKGSIMAGQGLLIILIVGLIAGWLASQFVRGTGLGLLGDLLVGLVGAVIVLVIVRLIRRRGRW